MRAQWWLLPALGLSASSVASHGATAERLHHWLHGRGSQSAEPEYRSFHGLSTLPRSSPEHLFLNDKTEKFAVNGSNIPNVDFDIGESYAGLLPISDTDDRDNLYFWFFPTANEEFAKDKEIVIWLNGGPGCSSLLGLLLENGPFLWQPGFSKPEKNPWSWHQLTNVVWIEQPVGVGFAKGQPTAKNEDDLARQFLGFWKNFVDNFDMHGWKVYIGAESYGGYYGPYISSHMLDATDKKYYDLRGLIIYDGIMFDGNVQSNVILESFVEQHYNLMPLDDGRLTYIHNVSEKCGLRDYHETYLRYPPIGPAPRYSPGLKVYPNGSSDLDSSCDLTQYVLDSMRTLNPCFNIYNIMDHCPKGQNPLLEETPYFDRDDVKRAINAPPNVSWSVCTSEVFSTTSGMDESAPPDNYELPNVIDKTQNVILAQGSFDFILPLNGVLLGIQNMTWGGKLGFQDRPSSPFYVPLHRQGSHNDGFLANFPAGGGVLGTTHHERGLTLVVTQLSGHEGPEYAPAASFRHLERLLGRVDSLNDTQPFTLPALRNVTQMQKPLGRGTVPIPCFGKGC